MKYLYTIFSLSVIILMSSCSSSRYYQSDTGEYYQGQPEITYQQFYNDLSPYGDWIDYGNYGYAWIPSMANFRPYYTNGHWVYTSYGWTWVSNYSWGWAPFHYGRWLNDIRYGWVWIPGTEWAPAWVMWRGGGSYYGWAPLGPGMGLNSNFGSIPYNDWTFVPQNYITSRSIQNYYINRSRNVTLINNTTIINNTNTGSRTRSANYNPGPPVREVERNTGTRIRQYNLETATRPGETQVGNNTIRVFRPAVSSSSNTQTVRPERNTNGEQQRPSTSAPVREFPKNQTPQIRRDEPPANQNRPSVAPQENRAPSRTFPERNTTPQPENNPPATNAPTRESRPAISRPPETNSSNQAPVRSFPNTQSTPSQAPVTREPSSSNQQQNNPPVNRPVRRM